MDTFDLLNFSNQTYSTMVCKVWIKNQNLKETWHLLQSLVASDVLSSLFLISWSINLSKSSLLRSVRNPCLCQVFIFGEPPIVQQGMKIYKSMRYCISIQWLWRRWMIQSLPSQILPMSLLYVILMSPIKLCRQWHFICSLCYCVFEEFQIILHESWSIGVCT